MDLKRYYWFQLRDRANTIKCVVSVTVFTSQSALTCSAPLRPLDTSARSQSKMRLRELNGMPKESQPKNVSAAGCTVPLAMTC